MAQEQHEEGGDHLHAYVRLGKEYKARGRHRKLELHSVDPIRLYYPNVQIVRNKVSWIGYILKDDHSNCYSYGIDPQEYLKCRKNKQSTVGAKLISGLTPKDII